VEKKGDKGTHSHSSVDRSRKRSWKKGREEHVSGRKRGGKGTKEASLYIDLVLRKGEGGRKEKEKKMISHRFPVAATYTT